ncbi:MAG: hypothetical protein IPN82_13280 [Chitinophagaceae bacterium]|nr:hypothetical protein [Chitinophagaceae bacterium]
MKLIPAMLHLLFGYFSAKAQQTTNVSGGTLTIENFTLDWSFAYTYRRSQQWRLINYKRHTPT